MIRYQYNREPTPPAPFIYVTIRSLGSVIEIQDVPAQLDTGADRTVVPAKVIAALGAVPKDVIEVTGLGGAAMFLPTFVVQVEPKQLRTIIVEVTSHGGEPFVLLGRDVLNHFRIILDGPNLALEID